MTVAEALDVIRGVGAVEASGGNLKIKFSERERTALQPAIEVLWSGKAEALALLAESPAQSDIEWACQTLNRAGVRIMRIAGGFTIGVWSDLDRPEVRAALRTVRMDSMPVRYLDAADTADIPARYKERRHPT